MDTDVITSSPDTAAESNSSLDAAFDALPSSPAADQSSGTQQDDTGDVPPIPQGDEQSEPAAEGQDKPQQVEEGVFSDGKGFRVSKDRMDDFQKWKSMGEQVIALAPSLDHIKQYRDNASDFRALDIDFQNGAADDASMDKFLDFWQGSMENDPAKQARLQAAFVKMADRIPDRLRQVNPQAYVALQQKMLDTKALREQNPEGYGKVQGEVVRAALDAKYLEAAQKNDVEMFRQLQWADYHQTGKYYKSMLEVPRPDPLMTEKQTLDLQRSELEKRTQTFEQQQQDGRVKIWEHHKELLGNAERTGMDSLITDALKPALGRYNEQALEQFKVAIAANVEQQLRADYTWHRDRQIDLDQLGRDTLERLKNGQKLQDLKPRGDEYINEYLRVARPLVQRIAAQVVSAKTSSLVKQSQEKHDRLKASQKPGTAGGGTPTARPVTGPNMTMEQKLDALLAPVR
jgi:hypothetical protein